MIPRGVEGILAAQALFLATGLSIMWALRGWRTWVELLRLAGLSYLLGVATVGVEATLVLVAGGGLPTTTVLTLSLGTALLAAVAAWRLRQPLPRVGGFTRPELRPATVAGVVGATVTLLLLAEFYRVARHQGLVAWDAWAFWMPKAKAIYFFGGLDETLFRTLWAPSYPIFVPALQAMDFHLMGSADQSTIALQYWFLLAGFVAAVAGLLRPRVPSYLLWPFLAMAVAMPELDRRFLSPQADWPLDVFFALAALCLALWLQTREPWLLGSFAILLAAEMATKREGQLLTACLVAGAAAATWRQARWAWPRVIGLAAAAYAVNIPWRIWWTSRHLSGDLPDAGLGKLQAMSSRVAPAFRIVLDLLFRYDFWLLAVPLAALAALALLARRRPRLAVLYLLTCCLGVVGFTWILWSIPALPLDTSAATPIPRAVGSLVLMSIALAPLLLVELLPDEQGDEAVAAAPAPA
jgi:hypothetical protein